MSDPIFSESEDTSWKDTFGKSNGPYYKHVMACIIFRDLGPHKLRSLINISYKYPELGYLILVFTFLLKSIHTKMHNISEKLELKFFQDQG